MEENILEQITTWKGRVIEVKKYPCYGEASEELLQYYNQFSQTPIYTLKYGEYKGMHLDITFSLYDTQDKPIELRGRKYLLPRHVTVEVYKEVMEVLGKQKMTAADYEMIGVLEGEKSILRMVFIEETLQRNESSITVEAVCILPIKIRGKDIVSCTKISLKEVL